MPVLARCGGSHHRPYADLSDELDPPSGDAEVVSVSPVGVVVVEDRFNGVGCGVPEAFFADVDRLIGEGGDDFCAAASKGSITWGA